MSSLVLCLLQQSNTSTMSQNATTVMSELHLPRENDKDINYQSHRLVHEPAFLYPWISDWHPLCPSTYIHQSNIVQNNLYCTLQASNSITTCSTHH